MASVIKFHIVCDGCETPYGIHNQDRSLTDHREMANAEGWTYQKGNDLCPDCRPKKRAPMTPAKEDPYAHF